MSGRLPERRDGARARGASGHGADCTCTRCRGFTEGESGPNLRHGAYATKVALRPRAEQLAAWVREITPAYDPSFEPTVSAYSVVLAQVERASAALDAADESGEGGEGLRRLREDLRAWLGLARRYAADLGLSPRSGAEIVKNLGIARQAATQAALRRLEEHVRDAYGGGEGGS